MHRTRRPLKAVGAASSKVSRAGLAKTHSRCRAGRRHGLRLEPGERGCEGFGAHPAALHHRVAPAKHGSLRPRS